MMKLLFAPNIGSQGRLLRGFGSLGLFVSAWSAFDFANWLGILVAVCGGFLLFEALRGWCALRACGIKTRL